MFVCNELPHFVGPYKVVPQPLDKRILLDYETEGMATGSDGYIL